MKFVFLILLWSSFVFASTTRTIQIDSVNATGGSALTVPSTGTALLSTASNIPVAGSLVQEVPSGTCNGSTTAFTLANTPGGASSVLLSLDGVVQTQGAGKDYTISGSSITLATACGTGQTLWAIYSKY